MNYQITIDYFCNNLLDIYKKILKYYINNLTYFKNILTLYAKYRYIKIKY